MSCSLAGMNRSDSSLVDRLERHADQMPDRIVYTWLDDDSRVEHQFTFAELASRARTLAAHFTEHAAPGERALLLYPHGLEFIAAFIACLHAGVVAVPAYPPRRNRSLLRLTAIHRDAEPRLILTSSEVADNLTGQFGDRADDSTVIISDQIPTQCGLKWLGPRLEPESSAFIQYTSGSTGAPKGVVVSHGNIVANEVSVQMSFEYSSQSRMISWLPMFHDMGLIGNVLQPLHTGFPSVLLSPVTFLREPIRWLRAISDFRGTTSGAPNFAYDHCVDRITEDEKDTLDLRSLTLLYNGAEPVRPRSLDRFAEAFARCGFRREVFFPCYGMAETTLLASGGPPQRPQVFLPVRSDALEAHRLVPCKDHEPDTQVLVGCGRTGHGTRIVIVDPETCQRAAPDAVGEIWVSGPSVAQGYWNRPEETEQTFRAYLAGTGEGPFLRTGDLGFIRDGEVFITGRIKDLIIIRGRNIYPHDVEATVEKTLVHVTANTCAAFGVILDGIERLALVIEADRSMVQRVRKAKMVITEGGGVPELEELAGRVREAVTDEFDITASTIVFVRPGTFPRTSSGKVQRNSCRAGFLGDFLDVVYMSRASENSAFDTAAGGASPKVAARSAPSLSEIGDTSPASDISVGMATGRQLPTVRSQSCSGEAGWLIGLIHRNVVEWLRREHDPSLQRVDCNASIASLGLDSVGAAAVALNIEREIGYRVTGDELYEYRTINKLGAYLETRLSFIVGTERANPSGVPPAPRRQQRLNTPDGPPLVVHREKTVCRMTFNVMPERDVAETLYPTEYRVWYRYAEATFDRHYQSQMLNSPDHLVFLTMLSHLQKLVYICLAHELGFEYSPLAQEQFKIWPESVHVDLPKLVTQTKDVLQKLWIVDKTERGPRSYTVEAVSRIESNEIRSRAAIFLI